MMSFLRQYLRSAGESNNEENKVPTYLMKSMSVNGAHFDLSLMASTSNQTISTFQCPITLNFDPTNITHLPASVVPTWISLITINIVTSPPIVLINLLVIWTVLENEQLRSNSYYFLVAILSLSDLLVGLVVQPLFVALLVCITVQYSFLVCEVTIAYSIPVLLCISWTVVTMAIVSLERYLYIEHPLHYQASVTTKKMIIATAVTWVVMGTAVVTSRFLVNSLWARQLPFLLTIGPSLVIILFCVSKIHLTALRQMRTIVAQQQSVVQQSKIKEYKRTFTLGLIVLASVAFLCPLLILKIVEAVKGNWSDDFKYLSHAIYLTAAHLQSLINPIIYSLRLSDIRSGVRKKLCYNRQ